MARKHTILVVDDEPDVVKSVQDLLRLDFRVLGATRASEGIKLLEQEEIHVVMSDQRMPEMTGVQFLNHVRGEFPEAIRLLFTGYADLRAVIDAINQGNVYRYITKPWDPDELIAVIREAVERYDLLVERQRLTSELETRNAQLQDANQQLHKASELREAFIQVASHELRTPLTILTGLSDLSMRIGAAPAPLPDWLRRMRNAADRLQHLVDQLLSMLSAGQFQRQLDRKPTDLAQLLNQAADDVRPFIELRKQTIALDIAPHIGSMNLDAAKIRDAVNHLLLNAVKFTPDGGRIALAASREGDGAGSLSIRVSDNGIGIPLQNMSQIFEPFFTGYDVSRHASGQFEFCRRGLGLGLCVVKAWVEMHGGTVAIQSQPDQGTTVTFTVPPAPPGVAAVAPAPDAPAPNAPASDNPGSRDQTPAAPRVDGVPTACNLPPDPA
jgi:signal transduction histidine kinase